MIRWWKFINITDVRVFVSEPSNGKNKGYGSITLEDTLVIRNLRIVDGPHGLFVSMPFYKVNDEYRDIFFSLKPEFKEKIQKTVLDKYQEELKKTK